ncbi:carboxypeptidase M32 [Desulforhopalus singaporensis]|uniref:Metal-dependent carboxypeptidase n=1 Tax=Desulforhopalus singaporensis TaxID=91360 RepID=A0A1H0M7W4_9BACT|nr:carboxypeptidase M32 [Desulforhopalus singaporensis]SDO76200.1 carboxypeptidase Taq [Desulforhopalus singaporensis]
MADRYQPLVRYFQKLSRIEHAITFLQWDHMVMMPPRGSEARSKALAELSATYHRRLVSDELGELLQEVEDKTDNPERIASIREMKKVYSRAVCLSSDLVEAKTIAGARCEYQWRQQRNDNDWDGFAGNFREVVKLCREEAQARFARNPDNFATPYDTLLDLHCTGDDSGFIQAVFTRLKRDLPGILEQVLERQRETKRPNLAGEYPVAQQQQLNKNLMLSLGFDFESGRLDVSAHPFSTGCRGDQRITTRYRENDFFDSLLATAHETGHASYENGLPRQYDGLPVGGARNLCLHESQSLLFEKQLLLTRPFLEFFLPVIHRCLPATSHLSAETLWLGATRVAPSLIRVEADEATYPFHVIIRFEIERDLINQQIEIDDIPELWDEKMRRYLGISTGSNFKDGCMQDMHWTDGSFGYFPSYTMGAINSAQFSAAIRLAHPDWQEQLAGGNLDFIRRWLLENIWSVGSTIESQEILQKATGQKTNPDFFLDHLKTRYLDCGY